jgi:hypothetical protein
VIIVAIKSLLYTAQHISAASQLGSSCEESIQCTKLGEPVTCDAGKCSCLRDALIIGGTCHKKKCEYIQTVNMRIWLKHEKNTSPIILRPQKIFSRIDHLQISPQYEDVISLCFPPLSHILCLQECFS